MRETFISSPSASMKLSAAVAAAGVVIALLFIERVRHPRDTPVAETVGRAAPAQAQLPAEPRP